MHKSSNLASPLIHALDILAAILQIYHCYAQPKDISAPELINTDRRRFSYK